MGRLSDGPDQVLEILMGRQSKIRELYQKRPHPFKALNRWARSAGDKVSFKRFKSLGKWARKRMNRLRGKARAAWDYRRKNYRKRQRYFKRKIDKAKDEAIGGTGEIVTFDGKPVSYDWAIILKRCRATGLWGGSLTSGYRSPGYSTGLCYAMCGAPSCPGRCAGASSNHSKASIPAGAAVDVSDPYGFRRALIKIGRGDLHNALGAADPWHFSITGR
jgi:hypothetical protein